jgi:hypothetical protein
LTHGIYDDFCSNNEHSKYGVCSEFNRGHSSQLAFFLRPRYFVVDCHRIEQALYSKKVGIICNYSKTYSVDCGRQMQLSQIVTKHVEYTQFGAIEQN